VNYLALCPDSDGSIRNIAISNGATNKDGKVLERLRFFRARSTAGPRKFLHTPLGERTLPKLYSFLNDAVAEELRVEGLTGHSGRISHVTHNVNSGVNPLTVSLATHHKDQNTLRGYVKVLFNYTFDNICL
jgi:hypothetical protein